MKKESVLNAFTIVAYCFCCAILIVWIAIIAAFALGYYTPKTVYAEDLYIDNLGENSRLIEYKNGYYVLRVNGITESDNPNILVDSSFVVRGKTTPIYDDDGNIIDENEVTETKIKLRSSNPDVATVQAEGNIGEPIQITVTKDENDVNKGGFCFIYVENEQNLMMSKPLVVFVDIPVTDLNITSEDMSIETEDEIEKFILYQDETATLNTQFLPLNSQDPSHIDNSTNFNAFRRDPKTVTYEIAEDSPQDVISIDKYGNITALKTGQVTVIAKTLATYDDIDFVENYEPEMPEYGDYIPPELLEGRYVIKQFVVEVKEVTLEAINIDGRQIDLTLFETSELSVSDLGISLKASNGNNDYFNNVLNELVLTTNSKGLEVKKDPKTNKWLFTVLQEPTIGQGFVVNVSAPQYPDVSAIIDNFTVLQNEIKELSFWGNSTMDENSEYNDLYEVNITKNGDVISTSYNDYTWDWTNNVEILPMSGNDSTSYTTVKVFAVGAYHNNSDYKEEVFLNEQGEEIIQLGATFFEGFGREVRGADLSNPSVVQALARGNIILRAYVIKTDIDGNPIDRNGDIILFDEDGNVVDASGQIITENVPTFVEISRSGEVTFRVIEKLTSLSLYVENEKTGEEELFATTSTSTSSKFLAVSSYSYHQVRLEANSNGALFDAYNNYSNSGSWIRTLANDDILGAEIVEEDVNGVQTYYLNLDVRNLNQQSEAVNEEVKIQYYTGNFSIFEDGYEPIFSLKMCLIEVPVESIKMNVNADPSTTVGDIDCYWISGTLNYGTTQVNGKQEVNSLKSQWGFIDESGRVNEITISQPTFTAGQVQALVGLTEGVDYVMPKALTITNTGFTYSIHDKNGVTSNAASLVATTVGSEIVDKIVIKELNTEVYITLTASYQKMENGVAIPITDTICVSGSLAPNVQQSLQWNTENGEYSTTASINELHQIGQDGGYNLRNYDLFGLKFSNASALGEDIFVSSSSQFISFEVASESVSKVKLTDDDRLIFAGSVLDEVDAHINVVLTTEDGLKIRQPYTIYFS